MSTTARSIITDAYLIPAINQVGQTLDSAQAQQGLRSLNQILGQWSLMPLTIPATAREVFPLTAGRGGPSDPYTIGPGGDFDTSRPTSITNVGLYDTSTSEPFEITRTLYTNDAYASIVQKELTSTYFTGVYFQATFAGGLATIQLWPVPSTDSTSLVLYRPVQLREFTSLDDQYDFPPGALPALTYELAKWMAIRNGVPWSQQLDQMAGQFLSIYQRSNTVMSDLGLDAALTSQAGVYNILSDSSSGVQGR
ncbi:MAG TPA: hypothetical protein VHL34_24845 [Rhizomicrobium sp.]|jgi:hypothetical protein|nr:hypothetical protein [Rhizomicrobium sp.]